VKDRTSVGLLVSRGSSLFALFKEVNLLVDIKAYKIWEDRPLENLPRNDIIVLDDDPEENATVKELNKYLLTGGVLIQLFPSQGESDFETVFADGKVSDDKYAQIFASIDADALDRDYPGLAIRMKVDTGVFVSFTKNVFTTAPEGVEEDIDGMDDDALNVQRTEERVYNFDLFVNLVKYLIVVKRALVDELTRAAIKPTSKTCIFIHGSSLWAGRPPGSIDAVVRAVFHDLDIDDQLDKVYKAPEYRSIDPGIIEKFPEIWYYHQAFPGDETGKLAKLAISFEDQAKKVHATIRAEKNWDFSPVPLFYQDLARLSSDEPAFTRVYLLPPVDIAGKPEETNLKHLLKCFLEPLAGKGVTTYRVTVSGQAASIVPFVEDTSAITPHQPDRSKKAIIIHGTELTARVKDTPFEEVLAALEASFPSEGALKVLIVVNVDKDALQDDIKEYAFKIRKVDEKVAERIQRDIERSQAKLHAFMRLSRERSIFEDHGYTVIEIDDSAETDQDIKLFFLDQVLPYVSAKRTGDVRCLLPRDLEDYLRIVLLPQLPADHVQTISM
jgi:hypothetical protein